MSHDTLPPENVADSNSGTVKRGGNLDTILAFSFGVVFCAILAYAGLRSQPITDARQFFLLRVLAALCAGGIGAVLPGFLDVNFKNFIRSGGALGAFAIVFLINPPAIVGAENDESSPYLIDESTVIFDLRNRDPNDSTAGVEMNRFDVVSRNAAASNSNEDFVIRSGTNGTRLEGESVSHASSASFEKVPDNGIIDHQLKHIYRLTIPASRFPPEESVRLHSRYRFVGAFQDETTSWVGIQGKYPTRIANIIAILPEDKPFMSAKVFSKAADNASPQELNGRIPNSNGSQHLLHVTLTDVPAGTGYAIRFDW